MREFMCGGREKATTRASEHARGQTASCSDVVILWAVESAILLRLRSDKHRVTTPVMWATTPLRALPSPNVALSPFIGSDYDWTTTKCNVDESKFAWCNRLISDFERFNRRKFGVVGVRQSNCILRRNRMKFFFAKFLSEVWYDVD